MIQNKEFFIPPQMTKHKKPKRIKPKPKIDGAAEEEIQEIMKIVREQKSEYVKKASRTKNRTLKSKSKSKSKKRNPSGSPSRKKAKTIIKRRKSSLESNHMPDISRNKKYISIDGSSDTSNTNKQEVTKINPDVQTPDSTIDNLVDHSQIKDLTNVSIVPKKIKKKKKGKYAMNPELKKLIITSQSNSKSRSKRDDGSNERHPSTLKNPKHLSDRKFSKRLFADREKTIANVNSLLTHGLSNRRSRVGKYSKQALNLDNLSEKDSKNMTQTILPAIDHPQNMKIDNSIGKYNLQSLWSMNIFCFF